MVSCTPSSIRTGRIFLAAATFCLVTSITGCGVGGSTSANSSAAASSAPKGYSMRGQIHGGQQPVTGSTITLYLAGVNTPSGNVTGYGSGATVLATTQSDQYGAFIFPLTGAGSYTCPTTATGALPRQAYIVATGGNPGAGTNTGLAMMAALGSCPSGGTLASTTPYVWISEETTVAAVWALQQFMAPPSAANALAPQIGAPNTVYDNGLTGANHLTIQSAVQGMNNAFITAQVIADITTGLAPNANYLYATPETTKINTLSDILAFCINTNSSTSSNCANFYAAATPTVPAGQYTATDTIQAAWYIAQNPIHNLANLWGYISSTSPYQPYLGVPGGISTVFFNDTTIAINYAPYSSTIIRGNSQPSDFALARAGNVAIDMYGNAWFNNYAQVSEAPPPYGGSTCPIVAGQACNTQGVSQLGVDGSVLANQIQIHTPSATGGAVASFSTQPAGGAVTYGAFPWDLAVDLTNRAWVVDGGSFPTAKVATVTNTIGTIGVHPGATQAGVLAAGSAAAGSSAGVGGTATLTNGVGYFIGDQPYGLTIDGSNNIFISLVGPTGATVPNFEADSLAKMSATDGSGYTVSTTTLPLTASTGGATVGGQTWLDVDTNTNVNGGIVWAASYTACDVAGNFFSTAPGGSGKNPFIASTTNYGLISQYAGATVSPLADSMVATSGSGATTGSISSSNCGSTQGTIGQVPTVNFANTASVTVDRNNGVWVTNQFVSNSGFDGLTYIPAPAASTGLIASPVTLVNGVAPTSTTIATAGTTLSGAERMAIDGNNNVWVTSNFNSTVAEASYNSSTNAITLLTPGPIGTGSGKYGIGFLHNISQPQGIAVDPSGNVWIANTSNNGNTYKAQNSGSTVPTGLSTTVIVGAAGPVITPKALAVKYSKIGQKP